MAGVFWFGTEDRMLWVPAPRSDADMSSTAWGVDDTLLGGGGFARHSWGSHKEYVFEWGASSSRQAAQLMKSFRDGTYGRGLVYFVNPNDYDQNIFPARHADPSIAVGEDGNSLVSGVTAEGLVTSGGDNNSLPITSSYYNLDGIAAGWRGEKESVFLPIPEGYTLRLGVFYAATGSGNVYVTPVSLDGSLGTAVVATQVTNGAVEIVPDSFSGLRGVRVWVGKGSAGAGSVTLAAMTARLHLTGTTPPPAFTQGPWCGGSGHSGCRFVGVPTNVVHSGANGGQSAYATTFKEVGDWQ